MNMEKHRKQGLLVLAHESNYSCRDFAKRCGVSLRKLQREFIRDYGCTPKQWLNGVRQYAALELLIEGCKVREAAKALGYSHSENFSRDFRRFFGFAPSHALYMLNILSDPVRPAQKSLQIPSLELRD